MDSLKSKNNAISIDDSAFKHIEANSLKLFGYSHIVLDGDNLRAADAPESDAVAVDLNFATEEKLCKQ